MLGLVWTFWRRGKIMDRNDALFWFLLSIGGIWTTFFATLIPSQEYTSAYGQQVLVFSLCGAFIAGGFGILVHVFWPQTHKVELEVKIYEDVPDRTG